MHLNKKIILGLITTTALCSPAQASDWDQNNTTSSIWGGAGLIRTRNARFNPDGQFEVNLNLVNPYRRYILNWQVFPWMEATFRYTDITNKPGQRAPIYQSEPRFWADWFQLKGANTFLDRGFDVKFNLIDEDINTPKVAIGLQDFLGTSIWSGEYLVASKKVENFDISAGLAWGQIGTRSVFPNPLRFFSSRFDARPGFSGYGGELSTGRYFSGQKIGVFAGIEYTSPWRGWHFKAEYDGSNPDQEEALTTIKGRFPLNFGASYTPNDWSNIQFGVMRGHSIYFSASLRSNFFNMGNEKGAKTQIPVRPKLYKDRTSIHKEEAASLTKLNNPSLNQLYKDLAVQGYKITHQSYEQRYAYLSIENESASDDDLEALLATLFKSMPLTVQYVVISGAEKISGTFNRHARSHLTIAKSIVDNSEDKSIISRNGVLAIELKDTQSSSLYATLPFIALNSKNDTQLNIRELKAKTEAEQVLATLSAINSKPQTIAFQDGNFLINDRVETGEPLLKRAKLAHIAKNFGLSSVDITYDNKFDENGIRQFDNADQRRFLIAINTKLNPYNVAVDGIKMEGHDAFIRVTGTLYRKPTQTLYYTSRVAALELPPEITTITVAQVIGNIEINRIQLKRSDIEAMSVGISSPSEMLLNTKFLEPQNLNDDALGGQLDIIYPSFSWSLYPKLRQHIGDPTEGIVRVDVDAHLATNVELARGLNFTTIFKQRLFGNLDKITRASDSVLPHVRSDIVKYIQQGTTSVNRMQFDYHDQIAPSWYVRASAGLLEDMFAGVGGEIMYRPWGATWALTADINWVKQRGYQQLFSFKDYETVTGHITLDYEIPFYGLHAKVSYGRYLAKDRGVTIDISRLFKNGVRIGAFSTFTNVSAEDFGEGSFDKGFYLSFPMELFLTGYTRQTNHFEFRPLTRDGGQKLFVGPKLYGWVENSQVYDLEREWYEMFQ